MSPTSYNRALEDAALVADRIANGPQDCERLGYMDPETGMRECALEVCGADCLCATQMEAAEGIAQSIRALRQPAAEAANDIQIIGVDLASSESMSALSYGGVTWVPEGTPDPRDDVIRELREALKLARADIKTEVDYYRSPRVQDVLNQIDAALSKVVEGSDT